MKTLVRMTIFLFFFCGNAHADTNPYMPGNNSVTVFDTITVDPPQVMQSTVSDQVGGNNPTLDNNYQKIRSQQADTNADIASEKADRLREMQALKEAVDAQLRDMQRKIDAQQIEIDDLRYKNRF